MRSFTFKDARRLILTTHTICVTFYAEIVHVRNAKKTNTKNLFIAETNITLQNPGLVAFYDTSGHETEWAYSYNPGARHGVFTKS